MQQAERTRLGHWRGQVGFKKVQKRNSILCLVHETKTECYVAEDNRVLNIPNGQEDGVFVLDNGLVGQCQFTLVGL